MPYFRRHVKQLRRLVEMLSYVGLIDNEYTNVSAGAYGIWLLVCGVGSRWRGGEPSFQCYMNMA